MAEVQTDRVEFGKDNQVHAPATQAPQPLNIPQNVRMNARDDDVTNPLGEPTIRCRVRDGAEFFAQFNNGNLVKGGEEYDVPISQARAASMFLDDISSGQPKSVPHEGQRLDADVPKAELAGRPRHERIGALEDELKRLDERKAQVQKQLEHEKAQLAQSQQPPPQPQPAAPVAPAPQPATDVSTTSVPPRPGDAPNVAKPVPDDPLSRKG